MAQLIVRNVDERLVGTLKRRAARHNRLAEAEHREILREMLGERAARADLKALIRGMLKYKDGGKFIKQYLGRPVKGVFPGSQGRLVDPKLRGQIL